MYFTGHGLVLRARASPKAPLSTSAACSAGVGVCYVANIIASLFQGGGLEKHMHAAAVAQIVSRLPQVLPRRTGGREPAGGRRQAKRLSISEPALKERRGEARRGTNNLQRPWRITASKFEHLIPTARHNVLAITAERH